MIVEFKVVRLDDKIIRVSSNNSDYPAVGALPLVTLKRVQVSSYPQLPDTAERFYQSLFRQMEGGIQ